MPFHIIRGPPKHAGARFTVSYWFPPRPNSTLPTYFPPPTHPFARKKPPRSGNAMEAPAEVFAEGKKIAARAARDNADTIRRLLGSAENFISDLRAALHRAQREEAVAEGELLAAVFALDADDELLLDAAAAQPQFAHTPVVPCAPVPEVVSVSAKEAPAPAALASAEAAKEAPAPAALASAETALTRTTLARAECVAEIVCQFCGFGDDEDVLLLCDCCEGKGAAHTHCVGLSKIPVGPWFCAQCCAARPQKRQKKKAT